MTTKKNGQRKRGRFFEGGGETNDLSCGTSSLACLWLCPYLAGPDARSALSKWMGLRDSFEQQSP